MCMYTYICIYMCVQIYVFIFIYRYVHICICIYTYIYVYIYIYMCILINKCGYYYLGTSDEHISIVQYLKTTHVDGAIVITTPQVLH
jgi:hypothetical protein